MAGRPSAVSAAAIVVLLLSSIAAVSAAVYGPGMEPSANGPSPCKAGYAKAGAGAFKCGLCSGARFQPKTGQSSCIGCPSPNAANVAHTSCIPGPGREPTTGVLPAPCKAGYAKAGAGAFACSLCSGQRFQPNTGATSCMNCMNGNATADHRGCTPGPGYQPGPGGSPSPCPPGTAKGGSGSFACGACGGTGPNGGQRYQPNSAATSCMECPGSDTADANRTSCVCPAPATVALFDPCDPACGDGQCDSGFNCTATNGTAACCFPSDAVITVLAGGEAVARRMDALRIGDEVLTRGQDGRETFEPVYAFGHQDSANSATFVQLHIQGAQDPLELTGDHFLPIADGSGGRVMHRARDVTAGQRLWRPTGDGGFRIDTILRVDDVMKQGLFNPYTLGGDIVVNGALASSHSSWFLDGIAPKSMVRYLPAIYQAALAPVRALYHAVGAEGMRRLDARLNFADATNGKGFTAYASTFSSAVTAAMMGGAKTA